MSPTKPTSSGSGLSQMAGKLSQGRQVLLFTVLILGAAAFVAWNAIYNPWVSKRQSLEQQYQEEVERSNLLSAIQTQLGQLKTLEGKIILAGGTSVLTQEVSQLASQAGLKIESVVPQPELVFGPYAQSQIQVVSLSGFFPLLNFLRSLETRDTLLKINEIQIESLLFKGTGGGYSRHTEIVNLNADQQRVTFTVSSYSKPGKAL